MKKLIFVYLLMCLVFLTLSSDLFAQTKKGKAKPKAITSTSSLTDEEITFGFKDAISNGVNRASDELGRQGSFYSDPRLKITIPPALGAIEKKLRDMKYDDLIDDLVVAMNKAAEQSIAESAYMMRETIQPLIIKDPKSILNGTKDALTQYFRHTSEKILLAKVTPLAMTANSEAEVLVKFKVVVEKGGGLNTPAGQKPFDVNEYVAQKVLDGMFNTMADEEKRIREVPAARTTAILQKIFGNTTK